MILKWWYSSECKTFKNEKEFTAWFGREVKSEWCFRHKLSDMDNGLKPFDAMLVGGGESFFIEFKMGDEKNSVDVYKKLRPNQIAWLRKVAENWWYAKVIYFNRFHSKYFIMDFLPLTKELIIDFKR